MDANDWSTRQLARELSLAQPQVVRTLALLNLPEAVQSQVEQGTLAPATAYEIGKLDDSEAQTALAERVVLEKLTRQEAVEAVRAEAESLATGPNPTATGKAALRVRPTSVALRVSDGVVVSVTYRKTDPMTPVQALRLALKQAQAQAMEKESALLA